MGSMSGQSRSGSSCRVYLVKQTVCKARQMQTLLSGLLSGGGGWGAGMAGGGFFTFC